MRTKNKTHVRIDRDTGAGAFPGLPASRRFDLHGRSALSALAAPAWPSNAPHLPQHLSEQGGGQGSIDRLLPSPMNIARRRCRRPYVLREQAQASSSDRAGYSGSNQPLVEIPGTNASARAHSRRSPLPGRLFGGGGEPTPCRTTYNTIKTWRLARRRRSVFSRLHGASGCSCKVTLGVTSLPT
jgi:hypothetical protein